MVDSEKRNPMTNAKHPENELLGPLLGEWSLAMVMPGEQMPEKLPDIGARVTFEWMGDKAFDGKRIDGTWEIAHDHDTWEKDFDLIYTRVG